MARKDMPLDQEESSGGIEKVMLFLIPIIFTIVLVGVLLTLFNINFRSGVMEFANKIPIVKDWVPDPVLTAEEKKEKEEKEKENNSEAAIEKLQQQLSEQEKALNELTEQKEAQENKAAELQAQLDEMQNQAAAGEVTEADLYLKQITDLAKMYASMNPSKAAPIIESLTNEEMVLILGEMKSSPRAAILEKMNPQKAADATMLLKDAKPAQDKAIAALQSRLKREEESAVETSSQNLDKNELGQTFSRMTPKNASNLLIQTYKITPEKAITILDSVDDTTRARILDEMSKVEPEMTARVLNRLMGAR
ncbi:MotE family protein [Paenibacillus lemnae]|uniref:Kinesin n=1 Tax=Paenibacillus lemnae TaxID=1330551 RepID=A0A848M7B8_PAELE|nr:kinesin [Paenibacillus lemnae]NMO96159.1 kinesin [Paenibacillus lemnae]